MIFNYDVYSTKGMLDNPFLRFDPMLTTCEFQSTFPKTEEFAIIINI